MKGKSFWSFYAGLYDRFMKRDLLAYSQMFELIRPIVKNKVVLELATGTGLIAKNIAKEATMVEATDSSPEMIQQAKSSSNSSKLHYSVQDIFSLPYANESFSVIIAANVLHIISNPEKAIREIMRVLTPDGILIVPTFTHGDCKSISKLKSKIMGKIGFPLQQRWTSEEYIAFLRKNNLKIKKSVFIKASLPLTYIECTKINTN